MSALVDMRGALIEAGRAAGAFLSNEVSDDFLMLVPGEVKAKLEALEARVAEIEGALGGVLGCIGDLPLDRWQYGAIRRARAVLEGRRG